MYPKWKDRIILHIPKSQIKKLKKGKGAQVMKGPQWYEIFTKDSEIIKIGKKRYNITKAEAREIIAQLLKGV